jgi:hypothetical protein
MTKTSASKTNEVATLLAAIEKLNHRLDKLEMGGASNTTTISEIVHPSLDKLSVAEFIADGIFAGVHKEKACQFEPDKPCDHCAMCSTRGF